MNKKRLQLLTIFISLFFALFVGAQVDAGCCAINKARDVTIKEPMVVAKCISVNTYDECKKYSNPDLHNFVSVGFDSREECTSTFGCPQYKQTSNPSSSGAGKSLKDAFKAGGFLSRAGEGAGYKTNQRSVDPILANIIALSLSFLGVIFLILMIYGGYLWMTAIGNQEQVTKARNLMIAAIIGLLVVIIAYAITYFIFFRVAGNLLK